MNAIAIAPMTAATQLAAVVEKLEKPGKPGEPEKLDGKTADFKATLATAHLATAHVKTAPKKPALQPPQAKKPLVADQLLADTAPIQPTVALVVQAVAPIADDLSSMISAGKSLVGAAVAAPTVGPHAVDQPAALEPVQTLTNPSDALPMTPLEQAVHDVLERLHDDSAKGESPREEANDDAPSFAALPGVTSVALHVEHDDRKAPAPVAAVREAPEPPPANTSHVHLVIDDGERLVVTVAVRGDQVITHVRGDNAETAAALARNAGVLDDHLRTRGLNLVELQATHDQSQPERRHEKPQYDEPERERPQPRFSMEEEQ